MKSVMCDLLFEFVRGQINWSALKGIGINISFIEGSCNVNTDVELSVSVSLADVVYGFVSMYENELSLRQWAAALIAIPNITFEKFDETLEAQSVIDILWKAAYGEVISDEEYTFILRLSKESS